MWLLLLLCRDCCWRWWWCFVFVLLSIYILLLLLLVLLLLLCVADVLLKSCSYACGFLRLRSLWHKKGSILLRTGNTIWKVNAKNIHRLRIKLSWNVKAIPKNVYIYESQCQSNSPKKAVVLKYEGIWDQLSDNSWRPRIKKLSDKAYLNYYRIKIWSCDAIVWLFGVRSTWHVV